MKNKITVQILATFAASVILVVSIMRLRVVEFNNLLPFILIILGFSLLESKLRLTKLAWGFASKLKKDKSNKSKPTVKNKQDFAKVGWKLLKIN